MKLTNDAPPSVLASSGMADAIRDAETGTRALLDKVVAEPTNMVALAAYNQSLKDQELLVQIATGMLKRNGDAQDAVVRNIG